MTTWQHFTAYANRRGWSVPHRARLWRLYKRDPERYEREGWAVLERDYELREERERMPVAKNPRGRRSAKRWTAARRAAFARRMKRARAAKRLRRGNPGRAKVHTARFDRCVSDVKRSLKKYRRRGNADAICQATLGARAIRKSHRRRRHRNARASGPVIEIEIAHRRYYYARSGVLSTSSASARHFASERIADRIARRLLPHLPSGSRVYVAG
jgi:hypothetical protein